MPRAPTAMTLCRLLCLSALLLSSLLPRLASAQPTAEVATGEPVPLTGGARPPATVRVETNFEDLSVGLVTSRSLAARGNIVIAGVGWKEACAAPCSFQTASGQQTLVFRTPGLTRFHDMRLRPGTTDIYVDQGNRPLALTGAIAATLGVLAMTTGGVLWLVDASTSQPEVRFSWAPAMTLIGAGATAGGLTMLYIGRVRIEERAPTPQARPDRGLMLHAGGTF